MLVSCRTIRSIAISMARLSSVDTDGAAAIDVD